MMPLWPARKRDQIAEAVVGSRARAMPWMSSAAARAPPSSSREARAAIARRPALATALGDIGGGGGSAPACA
jgi:hypothetical protein